MKLYECIFKVITDTNMFLCVDYVWSTDRPVEVGHYWAKLFNYKIFSFSVVEISSPPSHELKYETIRLLEEVK